MSKMTKEQNKFVEAGAQSLSDKDLEKAAGGGQQYDITQVEVHKPKTEPGLTIETPPDVLLQLKNL
jgi:hypothetical protein